MVYNNRQRKLTVQSIMDNPETLATLDPQDEDKQSKKHNIFEWYEMHSGRLNNRIIITMSSQYDLCNMAKVSAICDIFMCNQG